MVKVNGGTDGGWNAVEWKTENARADKSEGG